MAILALILVTAVWGVTFVQIKDAVAIYPLFAFLGIRFLIASAVLVVPELERSADLAEHVAQRMRGVGRQKKHRAPRFGAGKPQCDGGRDGGLAYAALAAEKEQPGIPEHLERLGRSRSRAPR